MVTRIADQRIYQNFAIGAAKHPNDDRSMYLVFTDKDNEEVHMFDLDLDRLDEYIDLLNQTKHAHKLHVASANEMPK
jgi:hypothetical protein